MKEGSRIIVYFLLITGASGRSVWTAVIIVWRKEKLIHTLVMMDDDSLMDEANCLHDFMTKYVRRVEASNHDWIKS